MHYSWITNEPEKDLWPELTQIFRKENLSSIAVNADPELAFASGLHMGEFTAMRRGLGHHWSRRLVPVPPMLPIEVIGTMVEAKALWYRKLMSTAWAMISEGFSERVITPGTTTSTVGPSLSMV